MNVPTLTDLDTAIRIYYQYPEIGNTQIKELFGKNLAGSTLARYKKAIRDEQIEQEIKTSGINTVNTKIAYEVFGFDIEDLEN